MNYTGCKGNTHNDTNQSGMIFFFKYWPQKQNVKHIIHKVCHIDMAKNMSEESNVQKWIGYRRSIC